LYAGIVSLLWARAIRVVRCSPLAMEQAVCHSEASAAALGETPIIGGGASANQELPGKNSG